MYDLICIGGGAASHYCSGHVIELVPDAKILILERGKDILQKVRISGGGRCNVTNKETDPKILAQHYPRGHKELIGPFHAHNSSDTRSWFETLGIPLKVESDGRVFPKSNKSEDIAQCLIQATEKGKFFQRNLSEGVENLTFNVEGHWEIQTKKSSYWGKNLFLGCGSSTRIWGILSNLDIKIVPPVPSLFTFNIKSPLLEGLMGISFDKCTLKVKNTKLQSEGPLLITHWGLSGPSVLKLSAWGALKLHELNYNFELIINFLPDLNEEKAKDIIRNHQKIEGRTKLGNTQPFQFPVRFWHSLLQYSAIDKNMLWADCSKKQITVLVQNTLSSTLKVNGKSTFKEEFVTAGGIHLEEINFKTFSVKRYPGLYAAGEILNIDGITGGFNFQAAWTGAWLAAQDLSKNIRIK